MSRSTGTLSFVAPTRVRWRGRTLICFAGNDYLNLSWNRAVKRALEAAASRGLLQPGASRSTTGEQPAYRRFEVRLARFFQVEDALLVGTGYTAPLAVGQALRNAVTHVALDSEAHPCVADAAVLTGRAVHRFRHGDRSDLRRVLRTAGGADGALIACGGAYGVRGGVTPLADYLPLLPLKGILLVDDAHGAGAVGPGGRGAVALFGLRDPRIVQTISLGKAFGVAGGAVLGSREWVGAVRRGSPAFIGSTAPLLPMVAALESSLRAVAKSPRRVERLQANVRLLDGELGTSPLYGSDPRSPVVGVFPASPEQAERLRRALIQAGIFPPLIRYLGGPDAGFFRFTVSAGHAASEIRLLAQVIRGWAQRG